MRHPPSPVAGRASAAAAAAAVVVVGSVVGRCAAGRSNPFQEYKYHTQACKDEFRLTFEKLRSHSRGVSCSFFFQVLGQKTRKTKQKLSTNQSSNTNTQRCGSGRRTTEESARQTVGNTNPLTTAAAVVPYVIFFSRQNYMVCSNRLPVAIGTTS